jgi:hypothetical protein
LRPGIIAGVTGTGVVRYLRTAATMAYPHGRLVAARSDVGYVLAPDGWIRLGAIPRSHGAPLTRQEAQDWCERHGWDARLLDALPD